MSTYTYSWISFLVAITYLWSFTFEYKVNFSNYSKFFSWMNECMHDESNMFTSNCVLPSQSVVFKFYGDMSQTGCPCWCWLGVSDAMPTNSAHWCPKTSYNPMKKTSGTTTKHIRRDQYQHRPFNSFAKIDSIRMLLTRLLALHEYLTQRKEHFQLISRIIICVLYAKPESKSKIKYLSFIAK